MPLVIVGNWDKSLYGQTLKAQYHLHPNIHILDPIYDQRKLDELRCNAALYIHGHSAGGTNPSLVEAMYLGLPVLAFGVSYNRVTTENKALYFLDKISLIEELDNLYSVKLARVAREMKNIAHRRYTWNHISKKYSLLIAEVLESNKKSAIQARPTEIDYNTLLSKGLAHLKISKSF